MAKVKISKDLQNSLKQGIKEHGKLPVRFKTKWIKALRSGKYEQGTNHLKSEGKYCCLGVACHIAGATGLKDKNYILNDYDFNSIIKSINKVPKVLHGDGGVPDVLASLNDSLKCTFNQIADFIEKEL